MIFNDTTSAGKIFSNAIIGLGNFDGVHIGHQKVLKIVTDLAQKHNLKAGILTFDPHPALVLKKNISHKFLMPLKVRSDKLLSYGLDFVIVCNFTIELSKITANEFIRKILTDHLSIAHCVTGCNFKFGHRGQGNSQLLEKFAETTGFGYTKVDQVTFDSKTISTSWIKSLLREGRLKKVKKLLGSNYSLTGQVKQGERIASKLLDTPTANIEIDSNIEIPLLGVYLIQAIYDNKICFGIANLGIKPTIAHNIKPCLEVHFFDFNHDLYGQILTIEFLVFLRPERKFDNVFQLKHAVMADKSSGCYILKNQRF